MVTVITCTSEFDVRRRDKIFADQKSIEKWLTVSRNEEAKRFLSLLIPYPPKNRISHNLAHLKGNNL